MPKDLVDKLVKLYVDCASWDIGVKVDDFLVAEGKTKTNSVYHVAEVRAVDNPEKRLIRYHVKCYKSDLMTCLKRDSDQRLIPIHWYNRNKKKQ